MSQPQRSLFISAPFVTFGNGGDPGWVPWLVTTTLRPSAHTAEKTREAAVGIAADIWRHP
jgi:hypothetical protein